MLGRKVGSTIRPSLSTAQRSATPAKGAAPSPMRSHLARASVPRRQRDETVGGVIPAVVAGSLTATTLRSQSSQISDPLPGVHVNQFRSQFLKLGDRAR